MNPVFVFLVILVAFMVWVMLSGFYKYIGAFFDEIAGNVKSEMTDYPVKPYDQNQYTSTKNDFEEDTNEE